MAAILDGGELTLSGAVGDLFFEDGFTHADVVLELAKIDDAADLKVRINSGGGVATEGAAIHALLSAREGRTDIVVEGIAASAASLIAMAGETVTMADGAVMMIHEPAAITAGDATDHGRSVEMLNALGDSYASVYAKKSGKKRDECRKLMKAETWFTAEQAVEAGFADATLANKAKPVAAFDYRTYAHAPKRLVALAKAENWSLPATMPRAEAPAPAHNPSTREDTMADDTKAGDSTARIAELSAKIDDLTNALAAEREARVASEQREAATARMSAVMSADGIKGIPAREKAAERMAATSTMKAEEVVALVKETVAEPAKPAATASLADRMAASLPGAEATDQPKVSGIVALARRTYGGSK